jgi:hypothetical protein
MNGRSIFVLLALSLSSILAACAGDEPAPQQSSTLKLDGTYRPTESGAIASITFSNHEDYLLVPAGCTSGSCFDIGTYRFDAHTNTIILRNGATQAERTIALDEVKTSEAALVLVKSFVHTRDFLEPGEQLVNRGQQTNNGQGQATGDQSQLNDGQQQLAQQIGELVKTIVEAIMDGQKMKQDEKDKKEEEKKEEERKKEECKKGVPTQDSTQAEKDAYAARCPNGP